MGYLILTRPLNSPNWTFGKWFGTHEEAQFWIQTLPLERFCYRIFELSEELLEKRDGKCVLEEDEDIPNEVITPQCTIDEECESCQ